MTVKNVLFLMIDQLRWDALSCYGNTIVETPNIDRLAQEGVRFSRAYTQGPSCGNSRASFYTGLHVRSHGATWNDWPFQLSEWTLADYMRKAGLRVAQLGKTHMKPDREGMERLGIDPASKQADILMNAGFVEGEHDDGLHPEGPAGKYSPVEPKYNQYLREQGFDGRNPWLEWANSAEDDQGVLRSGFYMQNAHRAARVPAEHSETAYLTKRIIETIDELGDEPWCVHASYIKPHWPYLAPEPYHSLYRDVPKADAVKSGQELNDPHPIYQAYTELAVARTFSDDAKRRHVLPTYYGLVKEIDDNIGRLMDHLETRGQLDETLVIFTSDHGDYMGDHWLGEKDLFHDPSAKIPLIIRDPSPEANDTRGTVCDDLVGCIDVIPTLLESLNQPIPEHRLEGFSLLPHLRNSSSHNNPAHRQIIVSETDYGRIPVARKLGVDALEARLTMAFDGRYKLVHCLGFPDMLFDVHNDPNEFVDLGRNPGYESIRQQLRSQMLDWSAALRNRRAVSREMEKELNGLSRRQGILIGYWGSEDVPEEQRIPAHVGVY